MSNAVNKSFLPAINKKNKPLYTLKTCIPEKKTSDSVFLPKSRVFDRVLEFQLPIKLVAPRMKLKDDVERTPPFMLSQSKKNSYTNLPGGQSTSSSKKFEGYSRQSRFEAFVRPLKDFRESSPSELNLSASFSPDKKLKKYIGPQSSRSKSEFPRNNKGDVNQTFDVNELKVIDSMEIDENEDIPCELEKELVTAAKKKKKGYTPLSEMVPLNLDEEKQRFFENEFRINPQFEYNTQIFKHHFEKPHTRYLKVAKMILTACMSDYGDDELYMEITGGRLITKEETEIYFDNYIKDLGLEGCLDIVFSEKTVAPTSVIHDPSGKSRVVISLPIAYRENRITGVMNHEIGTHFIRKFNDRNQLWFKNRKKFELKPHLIIEEGLAALNQSLEQALKPNAKPYLWNSALHYYSCYMSSVLGFEALFSDLEKYIKDPVKRWKECVRVKRGISDTSQPGGMYKDQVYLRGAIEILKKRKRIDFILLHSGKITVKDLQRLIKNNVIKTENLKLPSFLKDLEEYKTALDRIAETNFIDILKL